MSSLRNVIADSPPVIASGAKQSSNKLLATGFRVKPGMTIMAGLLRLKPRNDKASIPYNEAVLLAGYLLKKPKEYIIAHDDVVLTKRQTRRLKKLIAKRQNHLPIAYITGQKEFYGRNFKVNRHVLIPRPETEDIIDVALSLRGDLSPKHSSQLSSGLLRFARNDKGNIRYQVRPDSVQVLDLGTGSGCIGISLKLECPEWDVSLSDVSRRALRVAKTNAKNLNANVKFIRSDLLKNLPKYITYDIIVANLPYVNPDWKTSPELRFEPKMALFAEDGGLAVVKELIKTAPKHLNPKGLLILELDPCQHKEIIGFAKRYGLKKVLIKDYVVVFKA